MSRRSLLLIGESAVGKTHYGAQLLRRLLVGEGALKLNGAATNLEPFESALDSLDQGVAAQHTPAATYTESVWPVLAPDGTSAEIVWPDYAGEQVRQIPSQRRLPPAWANRAKNSDTWLLLVRPGATRLPDDIFSRPLADLRPAKEDAAAPALSDQARTLELLQLLLHARESFIDSPLKVPRLTVLLTCWDEVSSPLKPSGLFADRLPLVAAYCQANWEPNSLAVLGLSALERPLDKSEPDLDFARRGAEQFGYVVDSHGVQNPDLLMPITQALQRAA